MKKIFLRVLCIVCIAMLSVTFVACGNSEDKTGKNKTNIMEAEYTDLTGVQGGGHSSEASGVDMIYGHGKDEEKDKGWSGGYFVGWTHNAGVRIKYVFTSEEDATGVTIVLRLGSELGNLTFDPTTFSVNLNGAEIEYSPITVNNTPVLADMKFYDKTIATNATIKKGENTLFLTVVENELNGGTTAGPIIDCVKITTKAKLTWVDKTENPSLRGAI